MKAYKQISGLAGEDSKNTCIQDIMLAWETGRFRFKYVQKY